jgi:hypothetical protein
VSVSDTVILLVCADNTILFSPDDAYIDNVISKLRQSDIDALSLGKCAHTLNACILFPLVKDANGEPPNGAYNYASVIVMLQYLQCHS